MTRRCTACLCTGPTESSLVTAQPLATMHPYVSTVPATRTIASDVAMRLRLARVSLTREVRQLSRYTLNEQLPSRFRFVDAGSFWSPLLDDITDIDLMYIVRGKSSDERKSMSPQDAESLRSTAANVLKTTLKYRIVTTGRSSSTRIEEEHEDWASCFAMMQVRVFHHPVSIHLSSVCVWRC